MFELVEDASLRSCLEFIIKVDSLKKVLRRTSVIKNERRENTAEHSWHLTLMALVLQNYANAPIRLDRVIKMLVVHDLGEIQVGDVHLYDASRAQAQDAESLAAKQLFSSLPQDIRMELLSLWTEFSEGVTAEACFAQALDRFQPFLSNLSNDGGSWKDLEITKEKALEKNSPISEGSQKMWDVYKILAEQADARGCFHKESDFPAA